MKLEVTAQVSTEIRRDLGTVDVALDGLRMQVGAAGSVARDSTIELDVSVDQLIEANQTLAKIIRLLVDQTVAGPRPEDGLLPVPGPHLNNPSLTRGLKIVQRKYGARTLGDLANLMGQQVVNSFNLGPRTLEALETYLKENGVSFTSAVPPLSQRGNAPRM